ncbi:putative vacuolar protein sorting-associated protein 37A [Apostichopus japonicus]|uniref:Putative vacuolar protein sorting-associated protein 37A n=1 Tax=Stichopus japonicus TaxID=307972 RepID=A0A2G8LBZ6_STIJA|nr:putative vacuolar protein sorting-associated protein 37A [Apostichopus japonicus]
MAASWLSYLTKDQTSSSGLPPVTALQEQRGKQITSLRNLNPNVVEIKVQAEYRISITQQGHNIAIHIILPPQFPQEKPVVRVSPPVRHPWVSPTMEVIGCPRLCSFGVHTDLGRVVQDIVQEFTQNPPMVFPSNQQSPPPPAMNSYTPYPEGPPNQMPMVPPSYNSFQPMQNPPGQPQESFRPQWPPMTAPQGTAEVSGSISHIDFPSAMDTADQATSMTKSEADRNLFVQPNAPPPLLQGPANLYQIPDIDESFNILNDLSSDDLQSLHDDERKFMELFHTMPGLKKFFEDRTELYHICQGLDCKPALERKRKTVRELEEQQQELRERFEKNSIKQRSLNRECDPQNLLDNIRVVAADAEHSSDSLAEDFMEENYL